ncbi:hypothetical protein A3767_00125 [Oleiphilus sp. HI0133]|nr:hypothetical protein A3767_00125 [Oleiphilus sp. HI0133]
MGEYRYTEKDRIEQLNALIPALEKLISYLKEKELFLDNVASYECALEEAQRLLGNGFTQKELGALERSVPDLFHRHKEWIPPLETEGDYSTPAKWFEELEEYLQPARSAAGVLSIIGYY